MSLRRRGKVENELPKWIFWRTRFKEPHEIGELVQYLRAVADELVELLERRHTRTGT